MLLVLNSKNTFAQREGQQIIDSLIAELAKHTNDDTNRVIILNELSYYFHPINPAEGVKYGQHGLELATKLEWKPGIGRANVALGNNYLRLSDNPDALAHYQEAQKIYQDIGYKKGLASVTSNIGLIYLSENNLSRALENFHKALTMHEAIGNKDGIAIASDNIGDVLKNEGRLREALDYYFKALVIYKGIGKKVGIALVTQSIGEIYTHLQNYPLAIACMHEAIRIDGAIGDKLGVAWALTNIGATYLAAATDSAKVSTERDDTLNNAANSLPEPIALPDARYLCDSAISYLHKGLAKGTEINALDVMQACYKKLSDTYVHIHNYKQAREYYVDYTMIKDSVFSKENSEKMVRMEYANTRFYDSLNTVREKRIAGMQLRQQHTYTSVGLVAVMLLLCFTFFIFRERRKSEKLLLNILPVSVANELKAKGFTKAKNFDNVTVLYTDFVNFTRATEMMSPGDLIGELDACFKAFDEITGRYKLEKIKTIGDAYLAVAGLPSADPGHAENAVKAAINIAQFIKDRRILLYDKGFEIRIGIHSGNVVAGIVGTKKFSYDIWGSTASIASLMQQRGAPGRVNISQATHDLIKNKYSCQYHDTLAMKENEKINMYFICD